MSQQQRPPQPCRTGTVGVLSFAAKVSTKMVFLRNGALVIAILGLLSAETSQAFTPVSRNFAGRTFALASTTEETSKNQNVAQTEDTSRDKIMTFSYDMSMEPKYEKPTYPGTGNGLSGESGEYDVVVIGSGMGGLACGAISAKYGDKVLVLESHIKCGGSAHTFSRMHNGGKYSFEVGPSIFEGLDRPSLNPLRMIFDMLGEEMPVKTYTGLGYWTPTGYWRFPIGSQQKFEDLLMEQAEDGPKAVQVSFDYELQRKLQYHPISYLSFVTGMERLASPTQDTRRINDCCFTAQFETGRWLPRYHRWQFAVCCHSSRRFLGSAPYF